MLRQGASELGITLTDRQAEQLLAYGALILKWNKVYNLTALRDPASVLTHHLLDSLAVVGPLASRTCWGGEAPGRWRWRWLARRRDCDSAWRYRRHVRGCRCQEGRVHTAGRVRAGASQSSGIARTRRVPGGRLPDHQLPRVCFPAGFRLRIDTPAGPGRRLAGDEGQGAQRGSRRNFRRKQRCFTWNN